MFNMVRVNKEIFYHNVLTHGNEYEWNNQIFLTILPTFS